MRSAGVDRKKIYMSSTNQVEQLCSLKNIYMKKLINYIIIAPVLFISCTEWLDIKADKKQVVPQSIDEIQALLDHSNRNNVNKVSPLLEVSSDNVFLIESQWNSKNRLEERNGYIWAVDILEGAFDQYWTNHYAQIYYANVVLEKAQKITIDNVQDQIKLNNIVGNALFLRSWAFYNLAQLYAKQYDPQTAATDKGIPLRLSSEIQQTVTRSTVLEVYNQIISDLLTSVELLPAIPVVQTRASKQSSYALLARVYLLMADYAEALKYANEALSISDILLDYTVIDDNLRYPFHLFNDEVIYHQTMPLTTFYISIDLLEMYEDTDHRKRLFFQQEGDYFTFKGSYSNSRAFFAGLATDEVYLIKAECLARLAKESEALVSLKYFLNHRDLNYTDDLNESNVLDAVLEQRRLQLLFRGLRWQDIRRLNKDESRQVTLVKKVGDKTYALPPTSPRFVFAIPDDVINRHPTIGQNQR